MLLNGSLETYKGTSDLEKFNGRFKYSRVVGIIDSTNNSITSNETSITLRKDFFPVMNTVTQYGNLLSKSTYLWMYSSVCSEHRIRNCDFPSDVVYLADDQVGNIYLYKIDATTKDRFVLNPQQGTVDYVKER